MEALQKKFPDLKVGLIHGSCLLRKEDIMRDFKKGLIQMLVSQQSSRSDRRPQRDADGDHSAERFGLSQLHQLRGRVGEVQRNPLLLLNYGGSVDAMKRST